MAGPNSRAEPDSWYTRELGIKDMAAPLSQSEDSVILRNVSWRTYEDLLSDLANQSAPRLAFDRGALEIMSPTPEHEKYNRTIALLVEVAAEEMGLDIENLGSATFKRKDLRDGIQAHK